MLERSRKAAAPIRLSAAVIMFALVGTLFAAAPAAAEPPFNLSIEQSPASPFSFQAVTFTAHWEDVDTPPEQVSVGWDLNNDDVYTDAFGPTASRSYARAGGFAVGVEVSDGTDAVRLAPKYSVSISNLPPVASIAAIPSNPVVGQEVTFVSTSFDLDGTIGDQVWDVDADGFDDGSQVYVTKTFPAPGTYPVRLLVSDKEDPPATSVGEVTAIIGAAGSGGGQVIGASTLRLMSPFPIVRMSGLVRKRGIKLRLLTVNAPIGASVSFRCRGRGCPFKSRTRVVKAPKKQSTATAGQVRIRRFPQRIVRAGAFVSVYVTKPGSIGKYTRFRVRNARPPARRDRCLSGTTPISCPSG